MLVRFEEAQYKRRGLGDNAGRLKAECFSQRNQSLLTYKSEYRCPARCDARTFRTIGETVRPSVPGDVQGGWASERDVREVRLALTFHQP